MTHGLAQLRCVKIKKQSVDDGTIAPNTSDGDPTMNMKELVDAVSQETSIPAGQVKKVTTAVLQKFSELIEKEDGFRSSIVRFSTKSLEAKESVDGKPAKPERKVARMIVTPEKEPTEETES